MDLSRETGRALRRVRIAKGLTLRDAALASQGRFKPSSIAGYERGERAISVQRFCDLAGVYDVDPGRLLAGALIEARGESTIEVDRAALEDLPHEVRHLIASFVNEVLAMRATSEADRISIRSGDLEILAGDAGRSVTELARQVREALKVNGDRTAR